MIRNLSARGDRGGAISTLVSLLFLSVLCATLYFARHPIMRFAAESWIINEPAPKADAIVLLGDDNFYADRATHAAELFRQGVAPIVLASGRRLRPGAGISELEEHDLIERGVPKEGIVRLSHDAPSTLEEAIAIGKFAAQHGWKSLVLVTSNYHTRRTRYIYQRILPAGMAVSIASAHDGEFDPEHWWEQRKSIKFFFQEVVGMLETMWELRATGPTQTSSGFLPTGSPIQQAL